MTNCNTLDFTLPGDLILPHSLAYQTSWYGNFYQPNNSPLINAGSTNANFIGLYHYTVTANQVVDGTNSLSIGYHYAATDQYGRPLDSNGDGILDYLEDANGNGIFDTGDLSDWQAPVYSPGQLAFPNGTTIQIFEPKPASVIP